MTIANGSWITALLLLLLHLFFISSGVNTAAVQPADKPAKKETTEDIEDASFLTDEDFENAKVLTEDDLLINTGRLAWVQKDKIHGDLNGKAALYTKGTETRNGVKQAYDKWPNGEIPYVISNRYGTTERSILARAIQEYHDKTCIRFIPRRGQRDFLYIGKIDGCFSDVGRAGGRQDLSLDHGCIEFDTAIHELMHAVGFWHEHERWDRDSFITIVWSNIERDAFDQFGKVNLYESDYYGAPYDYQSIMHYDSKSFTKNGRDTMLAKDQVFTYRMGKVKRFSDVDLKKINKMYGCSHYLNTHNRHVPTSERRIIQQPWNRPSNIRPVKPPPPPPNNNHVNNNNAHDCRDKATLCYKWRDRCRNPHFSQIMKEFCPKTCGFCRPLQHAFVVAQKPWRWHG